jgi:hypothetical protein
MAAPVTPDCSSHRVCPGHCGNAIGGGRERAVTLLRYLTLRQWVEARESEKQQTAGRVTAQ